MGKDIALVLSGGGARGIAHIGVIEVLEEYGEEIGKKALELAKHSGRKTIRSNDIRLALR